MKKSVIVLLVLFVMTGIAVAQNGAVNSELDADEYFDFWVGKWEASWSEGDNRQGSGINTIEKILDGKVIRENFEILEGQNKGFKGTSISVYHPVRKQWKQAWADNQGGYYDFTGKMDGDKRIFQTKVRELEDGRKMVQRMVFYDITDDSMTWDWESSTDGGENWTLNWKINYTRAQAE